MPNTLIKGDSLDAYTTAHNQFVKDIGIAQEVLQKFGGALVTLHDKIVEAEEIARKAQEDDFAANMLLLGVLMFPAVVAAAVMPVLVCYKTNNYIIHQ